MRRFCLLPAHLEGVCTRRSPAVHPEMQKEAGSRTKHFKFLPGGREIFTRILEVDVDDNSSQCFFRPKMKTIHDKQALFWSYQINQ